MKAQIYNRKFWIPIAHENEIRQEFGEMLSDCGFTILGFTEHTFDNGGYTALWLLAESHLAVHSFPEEKTMYVELSGCNRKMTENFAQLINFKFQTEGTDVEKNAFAQ